MNNVKSLRIQAGMTQKELVYHMGVSQPTVSNWEKGSINPSGSNLQELSKLFGVSAGYILGIEDDGVPKTPEVKNKPAAASELVSQIIQDIVSLPYSQQQLVQAYVSGIKQASAYQQQRHGDNHSISESTRKIG